MSVHCPLFTVHRFLQFRPLDDLDNTPSLTSGHRPCFDYLDPVADLGTKVVMSHKFLSPLNVFTINRMLNQPINTNRNGLHHFVRRNNSNLFSTFSKLPTLIGGGCTGDG